MTTVISTESLKYKTLLCFLTTISFSISIFGQISSDNKNANFKVGVESNLLPFVYNGYHISIWTGKNGYRLRLVTANSDYPNSSVPDGFNKLNLTFYEAEFDFFFGKRKADFIGPWVASGLGITTHEVTTSNDIKDKINTIDIHFGFGYTFSIWKKLTANPWLGFAWHTNFPNEVAVGSEIWKPKAISPVGGLKIGYTLF